MSKKTSLICLVGISGSGKSTLAKKLLASNPEMKLSVSATTRDPREGESSGVDYHFLSASEFDQAIADDGFVEWEHVHHHRYGTLKKTIDDALLNNYDLLFDIDVRGAYSLKKLYPDNTLIVCIMPPSLEEMVHRIRTRALISDAEVEKRLETAKAEIQSFRSGVDSFIVNDDLEQAFKQLQLIVESGQLRTLDVSGVELLDSFERSFK